MKFNHLRESKPRITQMHTATFTGNCGVRMTRLVPSDLLNAEEAIHAIDGFSLTDHHAVGNMLARVPGFPEWPIANNPADAQEALDLVPRLTKALHAQVYVQDILRWPTASAPQFYPTFFEEAARFFTKTNRLELAQKCFNRAQEVERKYALEVDVERHKVMLQDFASLGVIGVRELGYAAKFATQHLEPRAALEFFWICRSDNHKQG
ncbi:MAG: hypothetical protein Q4A82_02520 [Corynebacterium sp.]|nr:hypothetical protein [Corynebacterium sp.]